MASPLRPLWLLAPLVLGGCTLYSGPAAVGEEPATCRLLEDQAGLRLALQDARASWGLPPALGLALLEPPPGRDKERHVLPYGNAWDEYRIATQNWSADPADLDDAVDFLGWNVERNRQLLKLDAGQVEALYLAYRLGPGAYSQGIHKGIWLEQEAGRVASRARGYAADLDACPELVQPSRWEWQRLWRWF